MKPTDEQIKEFWEWCGFTFIFNYDDPSIIEESRSPFGERLNPPIDLNSLFRYAVPKFKEMCASRPDYEKGHCDNDILIFLRLCEGQGWTTKGWLCSVEGYREGEMVEGIEDPALALFWAIYEVIK